MNKIATRAIVSLSGGQDSTTCLWWAKANYDFVTALTINYGQTHSVEIAAARKIASLAGVPHEVVVLPPHILNGKSPLVNQSEQLQKYEDADSLPGGLEKTFVPMRNFLFLAIAANRAACLDNADIILGVSEEDFGGYPDCRADFIQAANETINLALGLGFKDRRISIRTPLIHLNKKQTVDMARSFPGCWETLAYSHTCYEGSVPPCGHCHACLLRARGFEQAGETDPLLDRLAHLG